MKLSPLEVWGSWERKVDSDTSVPFSNHLLIGPRRGIRFSGQKHSESFTAATWIIIWGLNCILSS